MTVHKRPLSARLVELGEAIAAAQQRAREVDLDHGRAMARVEAATEAIVEAHATGDDASKLSKQREVLERGLRSSGERVEGAKRAVQRAEVERSTFAVESVDGLIAEREPDARAAAMAVEDAVERLGQAQAQWAGVETEISGLLRLAGRDSRDVPDFPAALSTLVRDARRAGGVGVPAPLPRALQPVMIAPHDDPDPDVRRGRGRRSPPGRRTDDDYPMRAIRVAVRLAARGEPPRPGASRSGSPFRARPGPSRRSATSTAWRRRWASRLSKAAQLGIDLEKAEGLIAYAGGQAVEYFRAPDPIHVEIAGRRIGGRAALRRV